MIRFFKNSLLLCLLALLPCQLSAQLQRYEYWFDDDYAGKIPVQLSGSEADINTEIPTDGLACGIHTLHFRVKQEGGIYSSISSTVFFKSAGQIDRLQYWFDDDFEHAKTTTSINSGAEITFIDNWDLSDVQEGFHRLYYRGISGNQQASTAISMAPVMVKSRYNTDGKELKVVQYSVSIDDEQPIAFDVLNPQEEITFPNDFDAHHLSDGNHTVNVHFWNSAGGGNVVQQNFKKAEPEPPVLTLNATEENGVVTLSLNTIPGGKTYHIYRKWIGAPYPVYRGHDKYESKIEVKDTPEEGFHHYYATCTYTDFNGERHDIESNQELVQVSIAASGEGDYGYLFVEPQYGFKPGTTMFDGAPWGLCDENGLFFQSGKVPVGQKVTISISDDRIKYDDKTVVVEKGRNHLIMPGTPIEGAQYDPADCDFVFDSDAEWVPQQFIKFKIKNTTTHKWTGFVRMRAVNQAYESNSMFAKIWETWTSKNMFISASNRIEQLAPGRSIEVSIPLDRWLVDVDEYYNLYFETMEAGADDVIKRIAVNYSKGYSIDRNPWNRLIEKTHNGYKSVGEVALEMANLTIAICSKIDGLNNRFDKLMSLPDKIREISKKDNFPETLDIDLYKYDELIVMVKTHYRNVEDHSTNTSDDIKLKTLSKIIDKILSENPDYYKMIEQFRNQLVSDIKGELGTILGVSKSITDCWDTFSSYAKYVVDAVHLANDYQRMDAHTKFFKGTKTLLEAVSESGLYTANLYAKAVKLYLDIAEITVNKALNNDLYKYSQEEAGLLFNITQGVSDFWKYKNNQYINFKVVVKKPIIAAVGKTWGHYSNFDFSKDVSQIRSAKVLMGNNKMNKEAVDTMYCSVKGDTDGFWLIENHTTKTGGIQPVNDPVTKLWVEICWKNGRTTVVPLKHGNGVDFSTEGGAIYTITFISDSQRMSNIADKIHLDDEIK